jgi:hypothetical protein
MLAAGFVLGCVFVLFVGGVFMALVIWQATNEEPPAD